MQARSQSLDLIIQTTGPRGLYAVNPGNWTIMQFQLDSSSFILLISPMWQQNHILTHQNQSLYNKSRRLYDNIVLLCRFSSLAPSQTFGFSILLYLNIEQTAFNASSSIWSEGSIFAHVYIFILWLRICKSLTLTFMSFMLNTWTEFESCKGFQV